MPPYLSCLQVIAPWRIIIIFFSGTITVSSHRTFIGYAPLPLLLTSDWSLTKIIIFFFRGQSLYPAIGPSSAMPPYRSCLQVIAPWRIIIIFFSGTITVSSHRTFIGYAPLPLLLTSDWSLTNNNYFFFRGQSLYPIIGPSSAMPPYGSCYQVIAPWRIIIIFFFGDNHCIQPSDLHRLCPPTALAYKWMIPDEK